MAKTMTLHSPPLSVLSLGDESLEIGAFARLQMGAHSVSRRAPGLWRAAQSQKLPLWERCHGHFNSLLSWSGTPCSSRAGSSTCSYAVRGSLLLTTCALGRI